MMGMQLEHRTSRLDCSNLCLGHAAWQTRRAAFTLIELLVVIAIISLLVSILLPSLNQARELAKDAVCSTNQRQIGTGFHLYASEYGGCFPRFNSQPAAAGAALKHKNWWQNHLARTGSVEVGRWVNENNGFVGTGVFLCPSAPKQLWWGGGYGVAEEHTITYPDAPAPQPRLDELADPSGLWLVGDARDSIHNEDHTWPGVKCPACTLDWQLGGAPSARHREGTNICFIDGHVKRWAWDDLYQTDENLFNHPN